MFKPVLWNTAKWPLIGPEGNRGVSGGRIRIGMSASEIVFGGDHVYSDSRERDTADFSA